MRRNAIPDTAAGQQKQFSAAYTVLKSAIAQRAFPGAAFGVLYQGKVVALDGVGNFTYPDGNDLGADGLTNALSDTSRATKDLGERGQASVRPVDPFNCL